MTEMLAMQKFDTINVIPFVDIMLVLLAIVLTTATFVQTGDLQLTLPQAGAQSQTEPKVTVEVAIDENGVFYLDGAQTDRNGIAQQLATFDKETRIALQIDQTTEFSLFVSLIDILNTLSLENVSIETRNKT